MNNQNEVLNKKNIVMYAKKIRDIQESQLDPYIQLIAEHISDLHPSLSSDDCVDWAFDVMNASSNTEVIETLDRLAKIQEEKSKEGWVCGICGENTAEVDCDYLSGVNHMSCLLKEEMKNQPKCEESNIDIIKEELGYIKDVLVRFETRLKELEAK